MKIDINVLSLRAILYERKKTQCMLADETGISQKTINSICNGKGCRITTAQRIADALNVKLDDLMR